MATTQQKSSLSTDSLLWSELPFIKQLIRIIKTSNFNRRRVYQFFIEILLNECPFFSFCKTLKIRFPKNRNRIGSVNSQKIWLDQLTRKKKESDRIGSAFKFFPTDSIKTDSIVLTPTLRVAKFMEPHSVVHTVKINASEKICN